MYNRKEIYENALKYFSGNELAADVWCDKYALRKKDDDKVFLEKSPEDTINRLVEELYRIEQNYHNPTPKEKFYEVLNNFKHIILGGSAIFGVGNDQVISSLANCYVIGTQVDSYGSICLLDQELVQLAKRRGGIGLDISHLRPAGTPVNGAARTSTGAVSFAPRFSNSTREVGQCIEANQRVIEKEKGLVPIKDIVPGDSVLTRIGFVKVLNTIKSKKTIYETKTKSGYKIKTSLDHIFLDGDNKEKRLGEFKKGDFISTCLGWEYKIFPSDDKLDFAKDRILSINKIGDYEKDCVDLVLEFENLFWCEGYYVHNSGRRGASIQTLNIKHPDADKFINLKTDRVTCTGSNISLKVDDEFMSAIRDGKQTYRQQFPVNSKTPTITKDINPQDLWKDFCKNNWNWAEPGLLFWDTLIRESLPDCYADEGFDTQSVNPCFPDYVKVLTLEGIKLLKEIEIGDKIWSKEGWTTVINKQSSGIQDVYRYKTTFGELDCTKNHKIVTSKGKVEIDRADNIEVLQGNIVNDFDFDAQVVLDGLMLGDGSVHTTQDYKTIYLCIGEKDQDYFDSEIKEFIGDFIPSYGNGTGYKVQTTLSVDDLVRVWDRKIPEKYFFSDKNTIKSLLRGLYSANGYVLEKAGRVGYACTSFEMLQDIQLLLSSLGIRSYYTINKPTLTKFKDKKNYVNKENYRLEISTDILLFAKQIGFIQKYKQEILNKISYRKVKIENKFAKIKEKEFRVSCEVFDITVDNKSHTFWCNGFNVSNCGEIPLCPYDSCRLTAVNFYSYVENPFTEYSYFNWDKFKEHVKIAMRIMDNIVDLECERLDQIIEHIESSYKEKNISFIEVSLWKKIRTMLLKGRRTGLGMMGGADMLAALGYKYGTPEATEVLAYTFRMFAIAAYESSIQMAHERGTFPIWSQKKESENPFLKRILTELNSEGLYNFVDKYYEFGRRNIACLTVAPTGTISIEAQTSGGFEPVFMLYYNRNKKVNPEDKNVRVDFTDEVGDSWQRYTVVHKPFEDWYRQNKEWLEHYVLHNRLPEVEDMTIEDWDQVASYSPYYKATANEIDVYEKIRMQGQVQKWIDHSISITHNLPADFPLEEISKIYLTAWEAGCKGCTIYRDGSRTGVLTKIEEKKEEGFIYRDAVKRPQKVETDIYCITALREKWIVLVGKVNDKPYEIFSFPKRNISKDVFLQLFDIVDEKPVPKKDMKYEVEKVDKRVYKLNRTNHECKCLIEDIVSLMENDSDRSDTKRISLELRHGIDPKFISQTIEKQYKDMTAFDNAIARVLKLYIKNGEEYGRCPECKRGKMLYQNGCPTCSNCGYSKCS